MFFNHPDEPTERREPNAVYARVDRIEDDGDESGTVLLDCIDRTWLAEYIDGPPLAEPIFCEGHSADDSLYILALDALEVREALPDLAEDQWYELKLGNPDDAELVADQYSVLFLDPNPRGVIRINPADARLRNELKRLAGLGRAHHSPETDILNALNIGRPIDGVGQGAATALLSNGVPRLYFDFGGSVIGNWRSFPRHFQQFCFIHTSSMLLSHWDWDHWSSAIRDRKALDRTWILPLQAASGALGFVHARFLSMLNQRANALWWDPYMLQQVPVGGTFARVVQSTGPGNNRNESGLVVDRIVNIPGSRSVLLPGDASFVRLTGRVGTQFDHLMVPHHGGKTNVTYLPSAETVTRSHAIYSYGIGNSFLHPNDNTVKSYRKGWKKNTHFGMTPAMDMSESTSPA